MARSKLNSIEKFSKGLIVSDISHEGFTLIINEGQIYLRLKKSISGKGDHLSDIEQDRLREHGSGWDSMRDKTDV